MGLEGGQDVEVGESGEDDEAAAGACEEEEGADVGAPGDGLADAEGGKALGELEDPGDQADEGEDAEADQPGQVVGLLLLVWLRLP